MEKNNTKYSTSTKQVQLYKVHTFRHAESKWNSYARNCHNKLNEDPHKKMLTDRYNPKDTSTDPDLTQAGIKQAKAASKKLLDLLPTLDVILLSPMSRTHSTLYYCLKELLDSKAITIDQIPPIKCSPWVMPAIKGFMDLPIMYKKSRDMF